MECLKHAQNVYVKSGFKCFNILFSNVVESLYSRLVKLLGTCSYNPHCNFNVIVVKYKLKLII